MTRSWRIYFGAVAAVFVSLAGLALSSRADQPKLPPTIEAKWTPPAKTAYPAVYADKRRIQLDLSKLKISLPPPPTMGDYPETDRATP